MTDDTTPILTTRTGAGGDVADLGSRQGLARDLERGEIAQRSPLTLKLLRRALLHGADLPRGAALHHEQRMISLVIDSRDAHEGLRAFLEKRIAAFKGR
jgi:enoyl-CoA hydratase